jgi:hypothetical protein
VRVATAVVTSLFAFVGLAGAANAQGHRNEYCQYGSRSSLFLVDRTTPYDATDRRVVIDSIGAVVEGLGPGDRIVVATIGSHYSQSERVIDECKPGCPPARGPLGAILTTCRSMVAMQDNQSFRARLRSRIRPLTQSAAEASNSDITGTIAQWTQHPPGNRRFSNVYVFSDMLENSQAMPWRDFRVMTPDAAIDIVQRYHLTPAVQNADVRIVGFGRLHDPGRPPLPADLDLRLRSFWRGYFSGGGAREISFEGSIS